jgi:hypothetical protein
MGECENKSFLDLVIDAVRSVDDCLLVLSTNSNGAGKFREEFLLAKKKGKLDEKTVQLIEEFDVKLKEEEEKE